MRPPLKITDEAVFTLQMWKWRELSRCCGAQTAPPRRTTGGDEARRRAHTLNFKCNLWWGWGGWGGGGGMISALVGKKVLLASERWGRQKMMVRSKAVGGPGFKFPLLDLIKMMLETTMSQKQPPDVGLDDFINMHGVCVQEAFLISSTAGFFWLWQAGSTKVNHLHPRLWHRWESACATETQARSSAGLHADWISNVCCCCPDVLLGFVESHVCSYLLPSRVSASTSLC